MTTPSNNSNRLIGIVIAVVVLALASCVCAAFVISAGGLFFFLTPGSRDTGISHVTPTPIPVSVGDWRSVSDLPRKVNVFLVDPRDSTRMFAGTGLYGSGGSGLYRSEDGGETWALAVEGLPDEPVTALALSPDSLTLYANLAVDKTIYASHDGGQSWQGVGQDPELCCNVPRVMLVAPDDPKRLYIAQTGADPNVSISEDGGATWRRVSDARGELQPNAMVVDPNDPATLYLGTTGHGVYRSTDRGETWSPANAGMLDEAIDALAVSPTSVGVVYAGSQRGHLYKSSDAGESWTDLTDRLGLASWEPGWVLDLAITSGESETITAAMGWIGLLQSTDGGATWQRLAMPTLRDQLPFPQDSLMAVAPDGRILLDVYYPDGETSGVWLCVP